MAIISTAEIAKIFDEIRDQRDAANSRAEAAEARAAQAEQERDELRAAFLGQLKTIEELRGELKEAQARIVELEGYIDQHNKKALSFLDDALNSGDGVYRP